MALAINIEDLLNKQRIESNRIEFKKGWNPASIYHSVCAFANDFDDLGGGYILVGVDSDDDTGMAIRPVEGVPIEKIDGILQDMVSYNNKMSPYYMPRTSVEEVDGKQVLVIWCPAGINRPYSVPENVTAKSGSKEYFYIRSGTSSIIAKGEVLDELRELASRVPFDERGNPDIKVEDISTLLLREYLVKVGSKLANELWSRPVEDILDQMNLFTGPQEQRWLKNVAAMMFCETPEKYFPYTQVDVVMFHEGKLKNPHNFTEKIFKGSVPQLIKQTMDYLRTTILYETVQKVPDRAEANRFWSYPYEALEEAVVNSLYHRDYSQHEPVEITIEPDGIDILNCPGPDRSISMASIMKGDMLKSRRYRNRYLGDFLKELDLTEGRSTGVPTIQEKLADNGSPRATFETTEDRLTFLIHIPIHPGCENNPLSIGRINSPSSSEKGENGSETSSVRGSGTIEKSSGTQHQSSGTTEKSSGTRNKTSDKIIELIKSDPQITAPKIAMELDMSTRGVEKNLRQLREAGIIKRIGSPTYGGYWEIIK